MGTNQAFYTDVRFWTASAISIADAVFGLMVAFGVGHYTDAERAQIDNAVVVVIPVIYAVWAALHTHENLARLKLSAGVEKEKQAA